MRLILQALAAVGLGLTPLAPAAAQVDRGTPAQDLDCAIWGSTLAGSTTDSSMQIGAAAIVGFFVGRYEMATGKPIDDDMVSRTLAMGQEEMAAAQEACAPRAQLFGSRLTALGKRITDESKKANR